MAPTKAGRLLFYPLRGHFERSTTIIAPAIFIAVFARKVLPTSSTDKRDGVHWQLRLVSQNPLHRIARTAAAMQNADLKTEIQRLL